MIFKGRRYGIIHISTTDFNPGYKHIAKFRGRVQWYMMERKDVISSKSFILKNELGKLVSFNGQPVTLYNSTQRT